MTDLPPPRDDDEVEALARLLRALSTDPIAASVGVGMATRPWPELAARAARGRHLNWMRGLRWDALVAAAGLPAAERDALDARLRAAGAAPLGPATKAYLADLDAIRARGRLASEEEYWLAEERLAYVRADPGARGEAALWEALVRRWDAEHPREYAGDAAPDPPAA